MAARIQEQFRVKKPEKKWPFDEKSALSRPKKGKIGGFFGTSDLSICKITNCDFIDSYKTTDREKEAN